MKAERKAKMNPYTDKPAKVIRIEKVACKRVAKLILAEIERIASKQDQTAARALLGIESDLIAILKTAKTY